MNEIHSCSVLPQNEFDLLVDFVLNVGRGSFAKPTFLPLPDLNGSDFALAAAQFEKWANAGGQ